MKEWFKKWLQEFFNKHGERLVYLTATTLFGISFIVVAVNFRDVLEEQANVLIGAGITFLIGAGQMCFNKARSPEDKQIKIEGGPDEIDQSV